MEERFQVANWVMISPSRPCGCLVLASRWGEYEPCRFRKGLSCLLYFCGLPRPQPGAYKFSTGSYNEWVVERLWQAYHAPVADRRGEPVQQIFWKVLCWDRCSDLLTEHFYVRT